MDEKRAERAPVKRQVTAEESKTTRKKMMIALRKDRRAETIDENRKSMLEKLMGESAAASAFLDDDDDDFDENTSLQEIKSIVTDLQTIGDSVTRRTEQLVQELPVMFVKLEQLSAFILSTPCSPHDIFNSHIVHVLFDLLIEFCVSKGPGDLLFTPAADPIRYRFLLHLSAALSFLSEFASSYDFEEIDHHFCVNEKRLFCFMSLLSDPNAPRDNQESVLQLILNLAKCSQSIRQQLRHGTLIHLIVDKMKRKDQSYSASEEQLRWMVNQMAGGALSYISSGPPRCDPAMFLGPDTTQSVCSLLELVEMERQNLNLEVAAKEALWFCAYISAACTPEQVGLLLGSEEQATIMIRGSISLINRGYLFPWLVIPAIRFLSNTSQRVDQRTYDLLIFNNIDALLHALGKLLHDSVDFGWLHAATLSENLVSEIQTSLPIVLKDACFILSELSAHSARQIEKIVAWTLPSGSTLLSFMAQLFISSSTNFAVKSEIAFFFSNIRNFSKNVSKFIVESGVFREMIEIFSRTIDFQIARCVLNVIEATLLHFPPALEVARDLELESALEGVADRPEVFSLYKQSGALLDKYFLGGYGDEDGDGLYDD